MCSAMPRRIAVIGSSVSPAAAARLRLLAAGAGAGAAAGAAGAGAGAAGAAGAAAGAAAGRGAPDSTKARMSFFVTRPPRPVPGTLRRRRRRARTAMRATTGETKLLPLASAAVRRPARAPAAAEERAARPRRAALPPRSTRRRPPARPARSRAPAAPPARRPALGVPGAADHGEPRPDLDRLALLDEDLRQRPGAGARHLGVDLVGRDLEQRLVGLDVLALGLRATW